MYSTLNVNHAVVTSSRVNSWIFKCHNSIIIAKFSKVHLTNYNTTIEYESHQIANIRYLGDITENVMHTFMFFYRAINHFSVLHQSASCR